MRLPVSVAVVVVVVVVVTLARPPPKNQSAKKSINPPIILRYDMDLSGPISRHAEQWNLDNNGVRSWTMLLRRKAAAAAVAATAAPPRW